MRRAVLILFILLLGAAGSVQVGPLLVGPVQAAGGDGQAKAKAKARKKAAPAPPVSVLNLGDLESPYSALVLDGVSPAGGPQTPGAGKSAAELESARQSNATSWKQDVTLLPKPAEGGPMQFRLGREKIIDPLTGKEVTPQIDPMGAKERLKELDLKGAVDKVGGKAEVQVDILKF